MRDEHIAACLAFFAGEKYVLWFTSEASSYPSLAVTFKDGHGPHDHLKAWSHAHEVARLCRGRTPYASTPNSTCSAAARKDLGLPTRNHPLEDSLDDTNLLRVRAAELIQILGVVYHHPPSTTISRAVSTAHYSWASIHLHLHIDGDPVCDDGWRISSPRIPVAERLILVRDAL
ncbi:hypothetical protein NUW54_g3751 [Trametes sanguinea]|uniref:Uncharacterized protein n=1 Tax=Trametes sanguinea TaxID=158606 RepID=A0ACC1PZV5_9APHY|nr:hypothetical protein NUW54_g3751 [Trametes sanguinea]